MKILIINGPNLNLLGQRDQSTYGVQTLADINDALKKSFPSVQFEFFQSNHEGAIIDMIQASAEKQDAIVINPGAYSHYSYAIHDAIADSSLPVVEVHISNVADREDFRRHSVISAVCAGTIAGFGPIGYQLAVQSLIDSK